MSKTVKIFVTVVCVFFFIIIFGVITGVRSDAGHSTPGILGLIVVSALIGALRAIWKNKNDDNNGNTSVLQK